MTDSEKSGDWLNVAMDEYRALRHEIVTSMTTQQSILSFGTATLGILIAGGLNVQKPRMVAPLILVLGVPSVCYVILAVWMSELIRMMRCGNFLADLEGRVNARVSGGPLRWETWAHRPGYPDVERIQQKVLIPMFSFVGLAAFAIGDALLQHIFRADFSAFKAWAGFSAVTALGLTAFTVFGKSLFRLYQLEDTLRSYKTNSLEVSAARSSRRDR